MLVESHLVPPPARGRAPAAGSEIALRFDHALMDAGAAALVFQYLESRAPAELAFAATLACVEGPVIPASFEDSEELLYVQSAARRLGCHFSPPGGGRAHHVYAATAAAPGRALLSCAELGACAGAVAELALPASELEMAAALTGMPHVARMP
jgi:hypothetical protein